MNRHLCQGTAAGLLALVTLASEVHAERRSVPRVCTADTHQNVMVSRNGAPASDRVLALIEGNLPLYAVDLALDARLQGEVTARQMEIMRAVAAELGMDAEAGAPTGTD
ncbi:hypothetical protein [Phreatobacter sp.]|uniref:hypothetical protein n=1 Tax=Phreatobacter sp. TaxID=1966341 RepID=UPI0025D8ECA4|nr:hypothetical protein [Phreatobacter sp.]